MRRTHTINTFSLNMLRDMCIWIWSEHTRISTHYAIASFNQITSRFMRSYERQREKKNQRIRTKKKNNMKKKTLWKHNFFHFVDCRFFAFNWTKNWLGKNSTTPHFFRLKIESISKFMTVRMALNIFFLNSTKTPNHLEFFTFSLFTKDQLP